MITIRYYGVLTDLAGTITENLKLDEVLTFADLQNHLLKMYPDFEKYPVVFFQLSNRCHPESNILKEADIDCMPPFSGG